MQRVYNLPSLTRVTVSASDVPELAGTSFGTILSTGPGVVAERTMGWDVGGMMAGGHTAKAIVAPSQTWYLAEGNAGFFDTFVLLVNPQDSPANATVEFLLDDGQVVTRNYTLPALGRLSIYANEIPELLTRSFGTTVHADRPILCERTMYFKNGDTMFRGGHSSAAVPAGSTHWFLAEGQTGDFFETFVLLANPNPQPVEVTIRYLTNNGVAKVERQIMAADQPHDDRRRRDPRDRRHRRVVRHLVDRADHRRALDVLGTVVRRAQQHGPHRTRRLVGAGRG